METKYVKVPFEVELAKRIHNGECEGNIITREGKDVRVVCWDKKGGKFPIIALVKKDNEDEETSHFTAHGMFYYGEESAIDLMLEIPEYMTFKDGDILMLQNQYHFVFVYKSELGKYGNYFGITLDDCDSFFDSRITSEHDESIIEFRKANTEEKQKLIDTLKARKEPKAKEYLKRFFGIEQKQKHEFKPFDRVICRDDYSEWFVDMFSHVDGNGSFACIGSVWKYCLPYNEQTAHLLGTEKDYKED